MNTLACLLCSVAFAIAGHRERRLWPKLGYCVLAVAFAAQAVLNVV